MKNNLWSSIHQFFGDIEILWTDFISEDREHHGDYTSLRSGIVKDIEALKVHLANDLSARDKHLVMLPIVLYIDELMLAKVPKNKCDGSPLLQEELFDITDGDEVFYDTLDEILHKSGVPSIVYEAFYFCLSSGYKGRHSRNAKRIESYKKIIHAKLVVPAVDNTIYDEEEKDSEEVFSCKPIFVYYACASGFVAATYTTFYILSIV